MKPKALPFYRKGRAEEGYLPDLEGTPLRCPFQNWGLTIISRYAFPHSWFDILVSQA